MERYRWADLFVFTSLRDTSGTGLLESLAAGTPVVCFDHQGAADIMTPDCAIPISLRNPRLAASQFRNAIERLASDPLRWHQLSQGAWQRAHDYSWDRLTEQLDAVYRRAFRQQLDEPPMEPLGLPVTSGVCHPNGSALVSVQVGLPSPRCEERGWG